MKKYFIVEEIYDDEDRPIGICETEELAQSLVELSSRRHDNTSISEEEWWEMQNYLDDEEDEIEAIHKKYPKYSLEDIRNAQTNYESGYLYTDYSPVILFENTDDFNTYYGDHDA